MSSHCQLFSEAAGNCLLPTPPWMTQTHMLPYNRDLSISKTFAHRTFNYRQALPPSKVTFYIPSKHHNLTMQLPKFIFSHQSSKNQVPQLVGDIVFSPNPPSLQNKRYLPLLILETTSLELWHKNSCIAFIASSPTSQYGEYRFAVIPRKASLLADCIVQPATSGLHCSWSLVVSMMRIAGMSW